MCFLGAGTFAACYRARQDFNYTSRQLAAIGAIAGVPIVAGTAIMSWSGFWVGFFGVAIEGPYWALIGMLIALVATRKEMALGRFRMRRP